MLLNINIFFHQYEVTSRSLEDFSCFFLVRGEQYKLATLSMLLFDIHKSTLLYLLCKTYFGLIWLIKCLYILQKPKNTMQGTWRSLKKYKRALRPVYSIVIYRKSTILCHLNALMSGTKMLFIFLMSFFQLMDKNTLNKIFCFSKYSNK